MSKHCLHARRICSLSHTKLKIEDESRRKKCVHTSCQCLTHINLSRRKKKASSVGKKKTKESWRVSIFVSGENGAFVMVLHSSCFSVFTVKDLGAAIQTIYTLFCVCRPSGNKRMNEVFCRARDRALGDPHGPTPSKAHGESKEKSIDSMTKGSSSAWQQNKRAALPTLRIFCPFLLACNLHRSHAAARAIARVCRERRLLTAVNFQLRWSPAMLALRDAISRGLIGTPTELEIRVHLYTPWGNWRFLQGIPRMEVLYHSIHYLDVVRHLDARGEKVLWAPDKHLGHYIERQTGADPDPGQGRRTIRITAHKVNGFSALDSKRARKYWI